MACRYTSRGQVRPHIYDYNVRIALFRSGKREHDGMPKRSLSCRRIIILTCSSVWWYLYIRLDCELLFGSDMNMIIARTMRMAEHEKGFLRQTRWRYKITLNHWLFHRNPWRLMLNAGNKIDSLLLLRIVYLCSLHYNNMFIAVR